MARRYLGQKCFLRPFDLQLSLLVNGPFRGESAFQ